MQLTHVVSRKWKHVLKQNLDISQKNRLVSLEKLDSKELYNIIISNTKSTPTSQTYFENLFPHKKFDWELIYLLPRLVTQDSQLRAFQFKILNSVPHLE